MSHAKPKVPALVTLVVPNGGTIVPNDADVFLYMDAVNGAATLAVPGTGPFDKNSINLRNGTAANSITVTPAGGATVNNSVPNFSLPATGGIFLTYDVVRNTWWLIADIP